MPAPALERQRPTMIVPRVRQTAAAAGGRERAHAIEGPSRAERALRAPAPLANPARERQPSVPARALPAQADLAALVGGRQARAAAARGGHSARIGARGSTFARRSDRAARCRAHRCAPKIRELATARRHGEFAHALNAVGVARRMPPARWMMTWMDGSGGAARAHGDLRERGRRKSASTSRLVTVRRPRPHEHHRVDDLR